MCREIYFIIKGRVEIFINTINSLFTCGLYFPGHYFGEITTVLNTPSPCSFSTATNCDLFFIQQYILNYFIEKI